MTGALPRPPRTKLRRPESDAPLAITERDRWHHARQDRRAALSAAAKVCGPNRPGSVLEVAERYAAWLAEPFEREES